ncbi:ElyC/SanA/YdcF family protein [Halomonas sp. MA07-2]|uniref:ElyC/SanA/YdcF family protein n=1 Tax=Halomonas sp. MA07-2 TaxID=3440841 RepID=UPI003EEEA0C7
MYEALKSLAAGLLMPMPVLGVLLVLGLGLSVVGWRRPGQTLIGMAIVLLGLASWAPVADRLLGPLEARYPAVIEWPDDESLQGVLVLGADWDPERPWSITAQLSDASVPRLMEGVRLWRLRPELPLLVSGGSRDATRPPVALGYAQAAEALGVPDERIVALDTPTDTGQEAAAVREALGEGARVLLVTSASHMPRAMRHFEAAGLAPLAAPTHYLANRGDGVGLRYLVPSASELRKTERAFYEWMGQLALRWER